MDGCPGWDCELYLGKCNGYGSGWAAPTILPGFLTSEPPQDVYNFMLAHKAFVPSAQRIIYRDPFPTAIRQHDARAKAFGLRQILDKHPHLGRSVRRLSQLHSFVSDLAQHRPDEHSSAFDQAVEACSWQADILRLCPSVHFASLLLRDADYARTIGQILRSRLPSSVSLHFPPSLTGTRQQAVLGQFARGLGGDATSGLNVLRINASAAWHVDNDMRPDYVARKIVLNLDRAKTAPLSTAAALLPRRCEATEELVLEELGDNSATSQHFTDAIKGNRLQVVTLEGEDWLYSAANGLKEDYGRCVRGVSVSLAILPAFPHARELTLRGFRDLDLRKLAVIARASPLVQILDLSLSFWTLDHTDLTSEHPRTSSFDNKLIGILDSMKCIESIDLGILPYNKKVDCRCGLRRYAGGRRIALEMDGCQMEEEE
ncbi:proteophosphoglycan 5 [Rhodotorula toruloides]|uniref:Proteophosphoglycan 5 n=1 Tax=Rhodotorula toruloides TaxID=5286 RepID=A0A511KFG8_RHOTO|nr:proteophosphoglycan 5 [Rhodotorula toruloides]